MLSPEPHDPSDAFCGKCAAFSAALAAAPERNS
jgi:hypothetical protein